MKLVYQFTIAINFDAEKAISEHGQVYVQSVQESARELAENLAEFLEKQPLVEGCRMEKV